MRARHHMQQGPARPSVPASLPPIPKCMRPRRLPWPCRHVPTTRPLFALACTRPSSACLHPPLTHRQCVHALSLAQVSELSKRAEAEARAEARRMEAMAKARTDECEQAQRRTREAEAEAERSREATRIAEGRAKEAHVAALEAKSAMEAAKRAEAAAEERAKAKADADRRELDIALTRAAKAEADARASAEEASRARSRELDARREADEVRVYKPAFMISWAPTFFCLSRAVV